MKLISGKDLIKVLQKYGFSAVRQVGSHVRMMHADGRYTVVPVHGNEELGRGITSKILKQTNLSREDIDKYL
jgi:predicted RNA binding protein YcfA (HicA-like mRNA interferase family)